MISPRYCDSLHVKTIINKYLPLLLLILILYIRRHDFQMGRFWGLKAFYSIPEIKSS